MKHATAFFIGLILFTIQPHEVFQNLFAVVAGYLLVDPMRKWVIGR